MYKCNLHTHSEYCDGQGSLQDYVDSALERKFNVLGFSSHAPLPFETDWVMPHSRLQEYFEEIDALKIEYEGRLEIHTGLEIDYIPGVTGIGHFKDYPLDFTIGSVHFLGSPGFKESLTIDGPADEVDQMVQQQFSGDSKAWAKAYYKRLVQMVGEQSPDILGHFDLLKKRNTDNRYFDEKDDWYRQLVLDTIKKLGSLGAEDLVIEVNTGGISRGAINTVYPSFWMIKEFIKEGFDFTLSSDAHHPDHMDYYYREAAGMLKDAGATCIRVLSEGRWQEIGIDEFL